MLQGHYLASLAVNWLNIYQLCISIQNLGFVIDYYSFIMCYISLNDHPPVHICFPEFNI